MEIVAERRVGWRFLAVWVVAGSVGFALGVGAGLPALFGLTELGLFGETADLIIGSILFGLFVGCGIGLGQGLALRPSGISFLRWFVASGLSGALVFGISLPLFFENSWDLPDVMSGIILGLLLGLSTTLGQWLLLRKRLPDADWWLVLGTLIPTVAMSLASTAFGEDPNPILLILLLVGLTTLTGLAMGALLNGRLPAFHPLWLGTLLVPVAVLAVLFAVGFGAVDYGPPPALIDPNQHLIFHGGTILTMDDDNPMAEAMAVEGHVIEAIGSEGEILALERPNSILIDLEGQTLMPGFVDAHTHLFNDAEQYFGMNLAQVQEIALRNGITAVGDMFVNESFLNEMREFEAAGHLRIRTSLYLVATDNCGRSVGDWWQDYGPERPSGGMLHVTGVKIFTDGGTCDRPALSYELTPGDGFGDLFLEQEELDELVAEVQAVGFQVAIHAIGDRAVEQAQNAIAAALNGQPNSFRHRIEHNSVIRPELLPRYGEIGIVPVVFGLYPNCNPFGPPPPPEYQSWEWPTRALIEANPGLPVAWHGDDPFFGRVRPLDDFYGLITRDELTEGAQICEGAEWQEQHTVTREQALHMMTTNSAYAIWRDMEIGRLVPGYYADLIVLNDNPLTAETADLKYLDVRMTMVNGRFEYCSLPFMRFCSD